MVRIDKLDMETWEVSRRQVFDDEFRRVGTFFLADGIYQTDQRLAAHLGGTMYTTSLTDMLAAVRSRFS